MNKSRLVLHAVHPVRTRAHHGPAAGAPRRATSLGGTGHTTVREQADAFAYQYIVEAACVARDLQYTLPIAHVEKIAATLSMTMHRGLWDEKCGDALAYLLAQIDPGDNDTLRTCSHQTWVMITPLLAMVFREDIAAAAPGVVPAVLDRVRKAVAARVLQHVDEGSLGAALALATSPWVLRSPESMAMVEAIHNRLGSRDHRVEKLSREELLRVPVLFAAAGLARHEASSNSAPRWGGQHPQVRNMRRLVSQVAERLLEPEIFNTLSSKEMASILQAMTQARVISPGLMKALLIRIEANGNYKTFSPSLLVEVIYHFALARCLHPALLLKHVGTFCAWLREETCLSQLTTRDGAVLVRALSIAKLRDDSLVSKVGQAALRADVLPLGMMYNVFQYAMNNDAVHDVVQLLCARGLQLNVLDKQQARKPTNVTRALTHLYRGRPMPDEVRRFVVGVLEQSKTRALDVNACVEALLSIGRSHLTDDAEVRPVADAYVRQFYTAIQIAEKCDAVGDVNEVTLSKYLLALASIPHMAHHVNYALQFLLRRPDIVSSLHPATMWHVVAPLGRYRTALGDLAGAVVAAVMDHALQPHVLAEFDTDHVFHLHRSVRNAGYADEHVEKFGALVDRLFDDVMLMESMTHTAAVHLLEVLAYLHRDSDVNVADRVHTLFITRIRPNTQYLTGRNRLIGMRCVRFIASLRIDNPSIVADVVKLATLLVADTQHTLTESDQCVIVSSLLQLHTLKPALLNDVVRRFIARNTELTILNVRWLFYGLAKVGGDVSLVAPLSLLALVLRERHRGRVEADTPIDDVTFIVGSAPRSTTSATIASAVDERELTLILWSLCRMSTYPQPFYPLLCRELADIVSLNPDPLTHMSPQNLITIVNGLLDPVAAAVPEANALLAAFLRRMVAVNALETLHYSKINAIVAEVVERDIREPDFMRAARAALRSKGGEEAERRGGGARQAR